MDIAAYRKQCLDEVAEATAHTKAARDQSAALGREAVNELDTLSLEASAFANSVARALELLGTEARESATRLAAMAFVDAAAFQPQAFAPFNADYTRILHALATSKDKHVRRAVLERLALSNDRYAHQLLREGLDGTRRPLVPAEKAAQLLGQDDHGSATPLLRSLAANGKGKVREEALRALSTDTRSAALLATITADKSESRAVRQIAALGLKHASPSRFAKIASKIVLDDADDDQLRATALSVITHTKDVRNMVAKPHFRKAVASVGARTSSRALKTSAGRFARMIDRDA
jgi:hypothetical protein